MFNISGTGCALADFLYNGISFEGADFKKYRSENRGDGGLSPGKLVFIEELEKFTGNSYQSILKEITGNRPPDAFNVGGPSLVSLIHASQMLDRQLFRVNFFGMTGMDETAGKIVDIVRETPLNIDSYLNTSTKATPFTYVFSDSDFGDGQGERTFVNNIGAAWEYYPEYLNRRFFDSHIICFGGTALVPRIHDNLTGLLAKAKKSDCITLVNTVYDFRNEKNDPGSPWPLVNMPGDYGLIDILIMDCEEALKISGQNNIENAAGYFASLKASSFIITDGPNDIYAMSGGGLFEKTGLIKLPVSANVVSELKNNPELRGDTTGCGDNFTGGIIFSLASQLKKKKKGHLDLIEVLSWGVASGGFTCFITGGTYIEKSQGEKLKRVSLLQKEYLKQLG